MKLYAQPGESIPMTAPYTVTSGQGALIGTLFGVATADITSGAVGTFLIEGVVTVAKATGVNWVQGALLYWDDSAKKITNVTTSNTRVGVAMQAQVNGDTTCLIRLNGVGAPTGA